MRVPVRALRFGLAIVWGVHVQLHREALADKMLLGKRPHQFDAVLTGDPGIGRQGDDDLARDLRVAALLGQFRHVPQHRGFAEVLGRPRRQQDLVVLGRVAMAKVKHLAGALGLDRLAGVVGGRAHRVAAGRARQIAGAGKLDRHAGDHDCGIGGANPADRGIYAAGPEAHSPECILRLDAPPSPKIGTRR